MALPAIGMFFARLLGGAAARAGAAGAGEAAAGAAAKKAGQTAANLGANSTRQLINVTVKSAAELGKASAANLASGGSGRRASDDDLIESLDRTRSNKPVGLRLGAMTEKQIAGEQDAEAAAEKRKGAEENANKASKELAVGFGKLALSLGLAAPFFVGTMNRFARSVADSNDAFRRLSPALNAAYAQLEYNRFRRDVAFAQNTGGTGGLVGKKLNDLEAATQGMREGIGQIKNLVAIGVLQMSEWGVDILKTLAQFIPFGGTIVDKMNEVEKLLGANRAGDGWHRALIQTADTLAEQARKKPKRELQAPLPNEPGK